MNLFKTCLVCESSQIFRCLPFQMNFKDEDFLSLDFSQRGEHDAFKTKRQCYIHNGGLLDDGTYLMKLYAHVLFSDKGIST